MHSLFSLMKSGTPTVMYISYLTPTFSVSYSCFVFKMGDHLVSSWQPPYQSASIRRVYLWRRWNWHTECVHGAVTNNQLVKKLY